MENFVSDAYKEFLEAHTHLNSFCKVSTAAIDFLRTSSLNDEQLSKTIDEQILNAGERWTPRIFTNPNSFLDTVKNDIVKSGVIWVYSSFDVFFKQVEGQLSGPDAESESEDGEGKANMIIRMYLKLGWSTDKIEPLIPIVKFYKELRNCVAHNLGRANQKLLELSESNEFNEAINNWSTKFPNNKISPPPVVEKSMILLKPHHAIIYSECCRRIAKDINGRLYTNLGLEHFIEKTIRKHLTRASQLSEPTCENHIKYIVFHLKKDYGLKVLYSQLMDYYSSARREDLKKRNAQKYQLMKPTD